MAEAVLEDLHVSSGHIGKGDLRSDDGAIEERMDVTNEDDPSVGSGGSERCFIQMVWPHRNVIGENNRDGGSHNGQRRRGRNWFGVNVLSRLT